MKLRANIKYNGSSACFVVYRDSPGVYHADLVYFDGDKKISPPLQITLMRGVRKWTGSCEDVDLLNHLGRIIEEYNFNIV
jgi:hypothetical protein